MQSTTVRVAKEAHKALREIAERTGESMQTILAKAVEEYRRKTFLTSANSAFAALRKSSHAWRREQAEREAWDSTIVDGLEKD